MEGIPLHCLQCAPGSSVSAHCWGLRCATTLKKPILKQSQSQTLTLETGTCLLTPGSTLYSAVLWGEDVWICNPASACHVYANKRPESLFTECKFHLYINTHTHYDCSLFLSFPFLQFQGPIQNYTYEPKGHGL